MLGFQGHADWRDMSEYLVHLTHRESFWSILSEGQIAAGGPYGTARNLSLGDSQRGVCLSEIPLDRLDRLAERHGTYGIGFHKDWIRDAGGAPVAYWRPGTPAAEAVQELVRDALRGGIDDSDAIWRLTPFVDNPQVGESWAYEFEWEREHRVIGELYFERADVVFLFAPAAEHMVWRAELARRGWQLPANAFLDSTWKMEDLQAALAAADL